MADTSEQSRTPHTLVLFLCAVLAIAALAGWYAYLAETGKSSALLGENSDYRQQLQALDEQFRQKTEELDTLTQRSSQEKSTLQAELVQAQQSRQQIEQDLAQVQQSQQHIAQDLAAKLQAAAEMQHEMTRLKSSNTELEQALAAHRSQQDSLTQRVSAVSSEKQQLLVDLEQAQARRQQLLEQIALVSADVAAREAELSASRQNIEQLDRELSQTRQEQDQLKHQVAQLSEQQRQEAQHFAELKQRLEQELNESRVEISQLKNRMTIISLTSEVLFSSGSARIKPAGREVLSVIASTLNTYPDRAISIEGHTDNEPIGGGSFYKSNWELSAARALAAVEILQADNRVAPKRLKLVGHGEFSPVASNATEEGRQLNRRIEIRLLPPG